jgi:predicted O-methyltransferase YrrM
MKLVDAFKRILLNTDSAAESLRALVAGCANQSHLLNRRFNQLIAGLDNQSDLLNRKLNRVIESVSDIARKVTPVDTSNTRESQPSSEDWKVEVRDLRPIVDENEFSAFGAATMESIELLLSSAAYNEIIRPYFTEYPKKSLMADESRAFIYGLVRMVKPEVVAEIGTFYAGTAEVFARALWENGRGLLYTTDPYGAERAPDVIRQWPVALQDVVRFSPDDSMTFLVSLAERKIVLDIMLIDGNHAYEFATFDLAVAAKMMRAGGVIIMDNAEQTGPFEAARQFLAQNPDWQELGNCISNFEISNPFAMPRCSIPGTNFIVLQAPFCFTLGPRLRSWGEEAAPSKPHSPGLVLDFSPQCCRGRLHFQAVYRGFDSNGGISEELKQQGSIAIELSGAARTIKHQFDQPLVSDVFARFFPNCHHTFELELLWEADPGSGPLMLAAQPGPQWIEPDEEEASPLCRPRAPHGDH